jgi:hypothetical protein
MFSQKLVDLLILRMRQTTDELLADGKRASGRGRYYHSGKEHNVLGVAHCDYVIWGYPTPRDGKVYGGQVDDRVGVWILLDVLPSMGIHTDILLTNDEETGQSTAEDFMEEELDYGWAFQFDRRGTDCVHYGQSPEWDKLIAKDFKLGNGTYSDVAELPYRHINVGCGYHHEHTDKAYVDLAGCHKQVERFVKFYSRHKDKTFPHFPKRVKYQSFYPKTYGRQDWDDLEYVDYWDSVSGFKVPALED